jgi:hypothetical protein
MANITTSIIGIFSDQATVQRNSSFHVEEQFRTNGAARKGEVHDLGCVVLEGFGEFLRLSNYIGMDGLYDIYDAVCEEADNLPLYGALAALVETRFGGWKVTMVKHRERGSLPPIYRVICRSSAR